MRFVFLLALLLSLTACDSSTDADADDVVGTWRLEALTEAVRVTSQTAQMIPDLSATPTASVTARGARTADLDVVLFLSGGSGDGGTELFLSTDEDFVPGTGTGAHLSVSQIPGSAQAVLTSFDGSTGEQFYGFFGDGTIITRSGGRFTIPPLMLDGAGTVTVGGTVVYPEITLVPGQPTEVRSYAEDLEGTLTVTFEAGGRFSVRANGPGGSASATGTWERLDADRIRITSSSDGAIDSGVLEVSEAGSVLVLKGENLDRDAPCGTACIRQLEPEVFAEAGSLSAVSFITTLRFRAGS